VRRDGDRPYHPPIQLAVREAAAPLARILTEELHAMRPVIAAYAFRFPGSLPRLYLDMVEDTLAICLRNSRAYSVGLNQVDSILARDNGAQQEEFSSLEGSA